MISKLANLLPGSAKRKINAIWKNQMKSYWDSVDNKIPKVELGEKHIRNLRPLANRDILLGLLPKNGIVAELGVDKGDFSQKILSICQPKHFHLIDFWGSQRYNQEKRKGVEKMFESQIQNGSLEINLGLSTEVVDHFPDNYFDWIYIDTDHSYKTTRDELEKYKTKMKNGGIIAGHDYIIGNWNGMVRYGVIEAVAEFCVKHNWEIIHITMENGSYPSFAIRRIEP